MPPTPKKLLDRVRDAIRLRHYAYSTEKTYVYWLKRFVLYHNERHPLEMGEKEISEFLTYLAAEGNVAASTQNQALSALLFLLPRGTAQRAGSAPGEVSYLGVLPAGI